MAGPSLVFDTVSLLQRLKRALFHLLYHQGATAYDTIAAVVSLGNWVQWVRTVADFAKGGPILELGFGPGHLQVELAGRKGKAFGLDESREMVGIARRRLRAAGIDKLNLARAVAGRLPFFSGSFQTVLATFPSEYIFQPAVLKEVTRVLRDEGQLVVLPMAWHDRRDLAARFMGWLFRVTGESYGNAEVARMQFTDRLAHLGFQVRADMIDFQGARLLVLVAMKNQAGERA
jgi:ubiquinone/menaquinone biosynthesis C-methylase UbiE